MDKENSSREKSRKEFFTLRLCRSAKARHVSFRPKGEIFLDPSPSLGVAGLNSSLGVLRLCARAAF